MIRMPRHASPPSRRIAAAAGVTVIALALPGCSDDEDVPSVTAVEVSAAQGEGDPLRFDTDDIAELLRAQPGELDAVADAEEIVEWLLVQFGTIEDDDDDESSAARLFDGFLGGSGEFLGAHGEFHRKLAASHMTIDTLTPEQSQYLSSWAL